MALDLAPDDALDVSGDRQLQPPFQHQVLGEVVGLSVMIGIDHVEAVADRVAFRRSERSAR